MSTARIRLARAGVAAGATLLALAAGEWLARSLDSGPPIVRPAQFSDVLTEQHHISFEELFVADDDRFWKLAPETALPADRLPLFGVIANAAGLREDHEIPRRKPRGETRILFVGDSTTFGYRVGHDETFVEATEASLREGFPDRSFECINAGVPGYTLFQGWRFLETEGWDYSPDLVVLNFGWNGAESWDGAGDEETFRRREATLPPAPLRGLRLARLTWRAVGPETPEVHVTHRPRLLPHEFRSLLDRIAATAEEHGSAVLALVGPGRSNLLWTATRDHRTPLQEQQYDFGRRQRLAGTEATLDLVPTFQRLAEVHPVQDLLFDSVHPTPAGHRAIAAALVRRLEPWLRQEGS
jgi:lysophospholipase L1-like esterase